MAIWSTLHRGKTVATLGTLAAALMLGACAETGDSLSAGLLSPKEKAEKAAVLASDANKSELEKATEYWGKKYKEKPTELDPAINFAKNLRAMGERQQALAVLQQAAVYHSDDKKLAGEYGRLALELDQVSIAKQMLAQADDPTNPDWRVISARGTVFAKEGKYREAIGYYERAMTLSQDQPSVLNNLAMAYAMNGDAPKAEEILRKLDAKGGSAKTRQNLALVLGLQGKFDEAKQLSARDLGAEGAAANSDYMRRLVKVETGADWTTKTQVGSSSRPAVSRASATPAYADPVGTTGAVAENVWSSEGSAPSSGPTAPVGPATLRGMETR